ncbi:MAG: TauD/TfdA family dioxygenase, partial [Rhizobiales bacterium]|nr:TauD/TfdA family dioxygenase [Hyphomicrobiales bacterium]
MSEPAPLPFQTTAVHPLFGVELLGCDLRRAGEPELHAAIRQAFENHSLLLFRGQHLNDEDHLAFAKLFGPIEDRSNIRMDGLAKISGVSNETDDGGVLDETNLRLLDLQANMLWHTDSTFLPVPALANILQARVVPKEGGATEFASTRAGFKALPPELQQRLRSLSFHHRYSHSRARIDPELAKLKRFTMWPDTEWRAVWTNPVTGEEALYIASHVFAVSGMEAEEGAALVDELIAAMTRPEMVYAHHWQPGDVIVWDERAVLHRGTPWPYKQPRTLVSVCVSA